MKAEEQITAYKSLRDNGQAFFVDTYEDCNRIIKALEKQIPKKPNFEGDGYDDNCSTRKTETLGDLLLGHVLCLS